MRRQLKANLNLLARDGAFDIVWDEEEFVKEYETENFFARLARMRQYMVEKHLKDYHSDVLWIDADIVEFPANLYRMLRATSQEDIVSPIVLIENSERSYDTAGMRESLEDRSSMEPPWFQSKEEVVELLTTGCCVVVPAWIHRMYEFHAQDDGDPFTHTEWLSICSAARKQDLKVLCDTTIRVYHANLEERGEGWH